MHLHPQIWGYVAYGNLDIHAAELLGEKAEMAMLRCRYGKVFAAPAKVSLCGLLPHTGKIIRNPHTLDDLSDIFTNDIDGVFD